MPRYQSWPTVPSENAFESEFSERYQDLSVPGAIPPRGQLRQEVAQGTVSKSPGGIVANVPTGLKKATPTVSQTRAVNFAVTVGLRAVQILASNSRRSYLIIQNTSASTIFLTFDRPSSFETGIQILSGGNYEPVVVPVNSVWAIANSANLTTVIVEGTTI